MLPVSRKPTPIISASGAQVPGVIVDRYVGPVRLLPLNTQPVRLNGYPTPVLTVLHRLETDAVDGILNPPLVA